jgi:signal transduction histidine kinase
MSEATKPTADSQRIARAFKPRHLALALVVVYQFVALIALLVIALNAYAYFQIPFIGSLVEQTLVINGTDSVQKGTWEAKNKGLTFGHQILAIDGGKVSTLDDFLNTLKTYQAGDEIELTVVNLLEPGAQPFTVPLKLSVFPSADRIAQVLIPFVIGLVYLGTGLWVLSLRRYDAAGQIFALFTASVAVVVAGSFEISSTARLSLLWTFSLGMAGSSMIYLSLLFPQEFAIVHRRPYLGLLSFIPAILLTVWAIPALHDFENPLSYVEPWRYAYIFAGLTIILFLGVGVFRRYTSASPIVRQQSQIILLGAALAFLPLAIWFLLTSGNQDIIFSPLLFLPLTIFPIAVGYAILRYRLLATDYIFSRGVLYALLMVLTVAGYVLLVGGLSLIFGGSIRADSPIAIGLMVFLLALLFNPVREHLQRVIDKLFFRGQQAYQERAETFRQELTPAMSFDQILRLLRRYIDDTVMPEQLHIFIWDVVRDFYVPRPDENGRPTTDIRFPVNAALPQVLSKDHEYIFIREGDALPASLESDRARLALLGAQLFIPLPGREQNILGFLALTPRKTGEPYNLRDLDLLKSFCDQSALSLERAQVISDLERRVTEMNTLIRVAQGINITLQFDDILELIYAQTNRLIPSRDFWIMLYDPENEIFQYAFYLEDDRRLLERERQYIFADQYLAQIVIRRGRAINTDDYVRECRLNGLQPAVEGLYAWAGVPLNAGATTIGSMSLASRDPTVTYSDEQIALLQAVADQAAGAIVKARLLEDPERSARQLALLNEVGRNLTALLDLPSLLDQILESAIEILNCEAGTLFLVDEETGELIFEVVKGPVAGELVGRRLPPGTGHVGRSVDTGEPAIVNEVRTTSAWSDDEDQKTGFKTRDLLLVPMRVKGRVVGVVEVINRRDQMPFTREDQDLLTTFTSQAAVALENARLYTLTDQKLAARVDELSVMQRIDRELNATLDVSRSMQITLDWALRQTGADAGLVGLVEPQGIRVMASWGYADELEPYQDQWLPLDLPGLKAAVEMVFTQQITREDLLAEDEEGMGDFGLLADSRSQVVVPIRREDEVIGVLMLESRQSDVWTEDTQVFLSRLTDHAAIAISNAQLFAQVQAADLAKTEFVSQVSHELKNPMTSMRGYTDLLISGAVGPVTEAQKNFLQTIRANVNRMATIVGDLADISRIESGHLKLEFKAVQISDVVDEVQRAQQHNVNEKNQALETRIPEDLPAVWGDRTRLVQILINLVSNANKYTPEGGRIVIEAERAENRWDPDGAPDVVRISVIDNGLGMTPEDQAKIFTKFFRSDDPKAREAPGTGLGLNITRNLVEMQGGKIWFESEYGQGTTFSFTVPVAEA